MVDPSSPGGARRFCLGRKDRLKARDDIKEAFARGRKAGCSGAKLFFRENGLAVNRVAFTFARKYGNAVRRNRSRRLSREAYRLTKADLKKGYDLVLLVYPGADSFEARTRQLAVLFEKAGLKSEGR